jgi:hypothetical protein
MSLHSQTLFRLLFQQRLLPRAYTSLHSQTLFRLLFQRHVRPW